MKNKVVLITGSAKGIGKAIALKLAKNGYDIVINYLTSEKQAFDLQKQIIDEYKVNCLVIKADVSDESQVDAMFSEIESKLNGVDILINNAAVDLSNLFNKFYHEVKIASEEDADKKSSYIALLKLCVSMLETCIDVLGFSAPEKM